MRFTVLKIFTETATEWDSDKICYYCHMSVPKFDEFSLNWNTKCFWIWNNYTLKSKYSTNEKNKFDCF